MLKGQYDESCDIWSAGIILYILMCGYPPFYAEEDKDILKAIEKGEYDFSGLPLKIFLMFSVFFGLDFF